MSEDERSNELENEQLPAFLEHIERAETQELERLRREYESAARAVRTEARRRSRQYHRYISEQTRTRLESEYARRLSRARSECRRRRWEVLQALADRAREKIWRQLWQRWQNPDRQLAWCRYWLEQSKELEDGDEFDIRISRDVHDATLEATRQWIADEGLDAEVIVDRSLGEGIRISRGERRMDGLLQSQLEHLLDSVHHDLAAWLHEAGNGSRADHE